MAEVEIKNPDKGWKTGVDAKLAPLRSVQDIFRQGYNSVAKVPIGRPSSLARRLASKHPRQP